MAFTPTSASGSPSAAGLREYSRFTKEYVMDRPVIDLFNFTNMRITGPDDFEGMGTGAPEFGEIGSSSIGGFKMTNTDTHGHLLVLPYWLDPEQRIDFRILWSNSEAAATGSLILTVTYTPVDVSTQSTATGVGATALDSTIDSQADLAANVARWTEWGYISANKTGVKDLDPGSDLLSIEITAALTTIADASVLQAQWRGYRKYI
jgi:hypothetical protein